MSGYYARADAFGNATRSSLRGAGLRTTRVAGGPGRRWAHLTVEAGSDNQKAAVFDRSISRLEVAGLAGHGATLVMERASSALYQRQSEASRRREEQLRRELPTTLVRKLAGAVGRTVDDQQAAKLGGLLHSGLGASGGPAASC